jgi:tRNA G18 (ribose-2'-O)-methylase SpoU
MTTPSDAAARAESALADFVALNDPAHRRQVERDGGYFVVEGPVAIERLLGLPEWEIRSLALLPKMAERLRPLLEGRDLTVTIADEDTLRRVVGFDIHRGALASVQRAPRATLETLIDPGGVLVAVEGVNDHENLGALYRNAAAFGASGVALDPTCADPFYRRSVRVSLGHVLAVPTADLGTLPDSLDALHARGVTTVALMPQADLPVEQIQLPPDATVMLLLGAEGPGLTTATQEAATHRVAISMAPGVDSLNVATAAAVALHQLSVGR